MSPFSKIFNLLLLSYLETNHCISNINLQLMYLYLPFHPSYCRFITKINITKSSKLTKNNDMSHTTTKTNQHITKFQLPVLKLSKSNTLTFPNNVELYLIFFTTSFLCLKSSHISIGVNLSSWCRMVCVPMLALAAGLRRWLTLTSIHFFLLLGAIT